MTYSGFIETSPVNKFSWKYKTKQKLSVVNGYVCVFLFQLFGYWWVWASMNPVIISLENGPW